MNSTEDFYTRLQKWNSLYKNAYRHCHLPNCKIVRYEDLIEKSEQTLKNITSFLNMKYHKDFLKHHEFVDNKTINQWTLNQVVRPIYNDSLSPWIGKVDYDKFLVNQTIDMLHVFGYKINFNNLKDGILTN